MKPIALLPLIACVAWAQQDAPPAFEVASVKVSAPFVPGRGMMRGCGKPDPALVHCTGATLKTLIMRAYDVKNYQIEGPAWTGSENYDVMAKVPDGVPADKIPAMLQALLAERFAVKIHKETRVLPVYELSIAKGGPKLKEVDVTKLPSMEPGLPPPPPPKGAGGGPPPVSSIPAGAILMMVSPNGARMVRGNMTIDQLANHLTSSLNRPVLDDTGLKGSYEIDLSYLGDENDGIGRMMAANGPPAGAADGGRGDGGRQQDANAPIATVFQALQETLGLKLDPKKAPIEMIVIDSANKVPTEN
jgi:uncharacterized protein (TIGR03435 family)